MLAVNKTITFYYADSRCDIKNIHVPLKKKWYSTYLFTSSYSHVSNIAMEHPLSRFFFIITC